MTVQLGLVGLGWGARVAEAARGLEHVRLAACYARNTDECQAFARRFGCEAAPSYPALLENPALHGVVLMTPNRTHAPLAIAALQAGRHVLVTKPIAVNLADAAAMIAASRRHSRLLVVGHQSRRHRGVRRLKALLEAGDLGRPLVFEGNTSSPTGLSLDANAWRSSEAECPGGPLLQLGIHYFDNAQYLLGPIRSVSGRFGQRTGDGPVEFGVAHFGFAAGAAGTLVSSYVSPSERWMRITGEAAVAVFHGSEGVTLQRPGHEPVLLLPFGPPEELQKAALREELEEFAACIRHGTAPEIDGPVGARNLAVVLAAVESHRTGRTVAIPDASDLPDGNAIPTA